MKISVTSEGLSKKPWDGCVVVPVCEGASGAAFAEVNRFVDSRLERMAKTESFSGQKGRLCSVSAEAEGSSFWVVAVGMGPAPVEPERFRKSIASGVSFAKRHRVEAVTVAIDGSSEVGRDDLVRLTVQSLELSAFEVAAQRKKPKRPEGPQSASLALYPTGRDAKKLRKIARMAQSEAGGIILARNLVNEPPNTLSPAELALRAKAVAEENGLSCRVLDKSAIEKKRMGLLLSVARGSARSPRLIHMVYKPDKPAAKKVAFVGKGITFDSGGLCIKPPKSMYEMKTDMAGAAVVLGIMSALRRVEAKAEVHAVIPCSDNMVGAEATMPGAVFRSMSGKTVEVLNTDAEGRLVLADAITYANRLKPDVIVDYATLTGSCVVALGAHTAGLFSNDSELAGAYLEAASRAGESMWRLPLSESLEADLKSDVADMKNIGGRYGGSISAALFLRRFVEKTPWVHVDIAGPARAEASTALCPRGGTGFGVLTALSFLEGLDRR